MKTPREILEFRAYQLYEVNPEWGRRPVAKALRKEYGQALRDSELDKIRKSTFSYQARKEQMEKEEIRALQIFIAKPQIPIAQVKKQFRAEFERPIAGGTVLKRYREAAVMNEAMLQRIRESRGKIIPPQARMIARRAVSGVQNMPEVDQSTYRERAIILRNEGFMKWEWQWLAFHDIDSKAMHRMRRDRRAEVRRWQDNLGLSPREIEDKILRRYRDEGWFYNNGDFNPFKMMDGFYKTDDDGQPTDKTPQHKRRGGRSDFMVAKRKTDNPNKWRYAT